MKTSRPAKTLLMALVVVGTMVAPPAGADVNPEPTYMRGFGPYVAPSDGQFEVSCSVTDVEALFIGSSQEAEFGSGYSLSGGPGAWVGVRAQAAGQRVDIIPGEQLTASGAFGDSTFVEAGETLRFVLATWGGSTSCTARFAGNDVALMSGGLTGIYLDSETLPSAGSATALGFGATAGSLYQRNSSGFMFMFLVSAGGATTVLGPDGYIGGGAGVLFDTWASYVGPTDGEWTYLVEAGAMPALWIIEMAAPV